MNLRKYTKKLSACDLERFLSKIDKYGPKISKENAKLHKMKKRTRCKIYTGGLFDSGYGAFSLNGEVLRAHVLSWIISNGAEELLENSELDVCHKCDNKKCINEGHMFLGTPGKNMKDKCLKGRQSFGIKHSLSIKNRGRIRKMTESQVKKARYLYSEKGLSTTIIAKRFGVERTTLWRAVVGETWKQTV